MARKQSITIDDAEKLQETMESLKDNITLLFDDKGWVSAEQDFFGNEAMGKLKQQNDIKQSVESYETFPAYKHAVELDKAFVLGSGVQRPENRNPLIQYCIDDVWHDPENVETFTGYLAMINQVGLQQMQGEVFYLIYVNEQTGESIVRVNDNASKLLDVITMKGDKDKILFYLYEQTYKEYDYENKKTTTKKVQTYIPAITATEAQLKEASGTGYTTIKFGYNSRTKTRLYGYLSVAHKTAVLPNRGLPPYRTAFKWASALKQIAAAAATMAKAKSKLAWKVAFPDGVGSTKMTAIKKSIDALDDQFQISGVPKADASTVLENTKKGTYEAVDNKLNQTGYRDTTTILMQQLASAFDKNEHYFGNPENANLATATSMELPVLKTIEMIQQSFIYGVERVLRFCVIKRFNALGVGAIYTYAKDEDYTLPEKAVEIADVKKKAVAMVNNKKFALTIYTPEILTKDFAVMIGSIISALNAGLVDEKQAAMLVMSSLNIKNAGDKAAEMYGDLDDDDMESEGNLNNQKLDVLMAELKKLSGGKAPEAPKDDKTPEAPEPDDKDNGGEDVK